jgi:hypothetical protein
MNDRSTVWNILVIYYFQNENALKEAKCGATPVEITVKSRSAAAWAKTKTGCSPPDNASFILAGS